MVYLYAVCDLQTGPRLVRSAGVVARYAASHTPSRDRDPPRDRDKELDQDRQDRDEDRDQDRDQDQY